MAVFLVSAPVKGESALNLYLFWGDGCPHCAKEKTYLNEILPNYPKVKLNTYEIYHNQSNITLMQKVSDAIGANASGVPFLIIGDKPFTGFAEGITDKEIESRIKLCVSYGCPDSVAAIVGLNNDNALASPTPTPDTVSQKDGKNKVVKLPIIGEIDALNYSLPIFTIIMGALDGFNPCAMWTLLFLISLLLGLNNRKKMWILGSAFIFTSAFCYFLFMTAWLNLIIFLGFVTWVRMLIGSVAIAGGGYSFRKGIKNRNGGCEVTGNEKRQVTFSRLREIVSRNNLLVALLGIMLLAFAVNLVELICSAGLPAVYTQVLALSDLATWQYYGYILLYIFFFMLDDLIVFSIAMVTLKLTGISTKYSRYSSLVGGALMIIIGLLLIFKPDILMFG